MILTNILAVSLLSISAVLAQSPTNVVNLINPLWALPVSSGGGNLTGQLAASILGVDATATTYSIGCRPNLTTITCKFQDGWPGLFTQGPTSMHWSFTNNDSSNTVFFSANYIFSSTLADKVTATEVLIQGDEGGSYINTQYSATTRSYSIAGDTSYLPTWYALPITAGLEKLTSIPSTITPAATLSSSTLSQRTGTAVSPTSSTGGAQTIASGRWFMWLAAAAVGVAISFLF